MDSDNSCDDEKNNGNDSPPEENGHLPPVSPYASGVGSPYAPENFPEPGDYWRWKVGKRLTVRGYFRDRHLFAPKRLKHLVEKQLGPNHRLRSKHAVVRFIKTEFPDADVHAFLASFSWKIPSKMVGNVPNGNSDQHDVIAVTSEESPEPSFPDPFPSSCKARNRACIGLFSELEKSIIPLLHCNICCSERGFCRECCCILCSKAVDSSHGGYSFIRCRALVDEEKFMCGHVAHLNCAIRAYTAGTVGGTIGLDSEYYCRRCDSRTDLVSHVTKLFNTCMSIESRDEVEKILNVGVSVLNGSQKASATLLLSNIYSTLSRLKRGDSLEEIWEGDFIFAVPTCSIISNPGLLREKGSACTKHSEINDLADSTRPKKQPYKKSIFSISRIHHQKLDNDITNVLQAMKRAQESEYRMVEEGLHAQRNHLTNLYEQLEHEISALKEQKLSRTTTASVDSISRRKDQIKGEHEKLLRMLEVARHYGRTPRKILGEHFDTRSE